jgi:hypothetical protein
VEVGTLPYFLRIRRTRKRELGKTRDPLVGLRAAQRRLAGSRGWKPEFEDFDEFRYGPGFQFRVLTYCGEFLGT